MGGETARRLAAQHVLVAIEDADLRDGVTAVVHELTGMFVVHVTSLAATAERALAEPPRVVLIDATLPGDIVAFSRDLNERGIGVVLLSTHPRNVAHVADAVVLGVPFDVDDLVTAIDRAQPHPRSNIRPR